MASLPGAAVLYILKAGGGCRALGGLCEDRLAMNLGLSIPSFPGTRTVGGQEGATDTSARHLPDFAPWLPLIWKDL